ncbi:MAG: sigma-70 family RNA polymerase sigma factor [Christensenellales bacterium]
MVTIVYEGQRVLVTQEVAAFLEQDDRRMRTQARSDRRHLAYCRVDPDKAVITHRRKGVNLVLNQVMRNLETEELRKAVNTLPAEDRLLIQYRYCDGLTMQEIGELFGISKMAVSKRHKKLLGKLRAMLSASSLLAVLLLSLFFRILKKVCSFPLVYKFLLSVL